MTIGKVYGGDNDIDVSTAEEKPAEAVDGKPNKVPSILKHYL